MNRQELLERIDGLGLPKFQYIVLAGGSMVLHELRDETNDLDLCVNENVAKQLDLFGKSPNERGYYELGDGIDVMVGLEKIAPEVREFSNGRKIMCQTLDDILKFKKARNDPKDEADIRLLEDAIEQQGHS